MAPFGGATPVARLLYPRAIGMLLCHFGACSTLHRSRSQVCQLEHGACSETCCKRDVPFYLVAMRLTGNKNVKYLEITVTYGKF